MATIAENLQTIKDSTAAIKQSIINKGGEISGNITTWASAIDKIDTGGGGEVVPTLEEKDVNFYDYDGTRLYSYTWEEAMAMTELPPLPTQKGLICQEWNYTLEDIKAQNGACDVGATYITDDGKTRFYLTIDNERAKDIWLYLGGNIEVNWGDGTIESHNSKILQLNHKYTKYGDYVVSIEVKSGTLELRGGTSFNVMGELLAPSAERLNTLRKIEIGGKVESLPDRVFQGCSSLKYAVIPNGVNRLNNYTFRYCSSLECVVIPSSVTQISFDNFACCGSLRVVVIPLSVKKLGGSNFRNCLLLACIFIHNGIISFGNGEFNGCIALRTITLNGVTMGNNAFASCISLQKVVILSGDVSIGAYCFSEAFSLAYIDCSKCSTIPTLSSSNLMSGKFFTKIIVPDALYNEWIVATNWAGLESYIVKDSEYTRPI